MPTETETPTLVGPGGHTCTLQPVDADLEQEWERLAARCAAPPYLRPAWFRMWMGAFRPRHRLSLLTARRRGELVAAVPLLAGRLGTRLPVNSETPGFAPLSVDERAAEALAAALLDRSQRVELLFVPAGQDERALTAAAADRGCRTLREVVRRSPYTRLDQDWTVLRTEVLGRSRRKSIDRRRRQLAELGELTFEVHRDTERLHTLLAEGLALEAAGWKGAERTAVLSRPSSADFYARLAGWAADHGLLRLHFLRLDGRPIAFELALEQSGAVHVLKTAYDETLRRFGPGIMILDDGLADTSREPGLHVSESLGEDDPYKLEFSTGVREQLRILVFRDTVPGVTAYALHRLTVVAREQARNRLPESVKLRLARFAAT